MIEQHTIKDSAMRNMQPETIERREAGFTLIELIVVVIILGILAAVALPRFTNLQRDARIAKLQAARGSVMAASTLIHATVLTRAGVADTSDCPAGGGTADNSPGATGSICTENGLVHTVYGYPAVTAFASTTPGILSAAGLTGIFNPTQAQLEAEGYTYAANGSVATFGVLGASDAANCSFTYTQSTAANVAAQVNDFNNSGC